MSTRGRNTAYLLIDGGCYGVARAVKTRLHSRGRSQSRECYPENSYGHRFHIPRTPTGMLVIIQIHILHQDSASLYSSTVHRLCNPSSSIEGLDQKTDICLTSTSKYQRARLQSHRLLHYSLPCTVCQLSTQIASELKVPHQLTWLRLFTNIQDQWCSTVECVGSGNSENTEVSSYFSCHGMSSTPHFRVVIRTSSVKASLRKH